MEELLPGHARVSKKRNPSMVNATSEQHAAGQPAPAPPSASPPRVHWIVRQNWLQRTVFFALLAVIFGVQLHEIQAPAWSWLPLVAHFFVYPQLVYLHARHATSRNRQRDIERRYMVLDNTLYGLWMVGTGFPLWPTICLWLGGLVSMVAYRGLPGVLSMLLGLVPGLAIGMLLFQPLTLNVQNSARVTLLTIPVLTAFLLMYARANHVRAYSLYEGRQQMRRQLAEIQGLQAQLRETALRDPLTGLFNRRHFADALPRLIARCKRQNTPLTLIMMDIDHFKQVNDNHGHAAGDAILVALAEMLQGHVRQSDLICRLGGEEFVLVLENAPLQAAARRAEVVRERFARISITYEEAPVQATLSCGLATFPQHGTNMDTLLRAADRALYAAKAHGRNRVEVAAPART